MGTVLAFRIFAGSQFMFSRQEGEVHIKNGFVHFEFLYFQFLQEDALWGQFSCYGELNFTGR